MDINEFTQQVQPRKKRSRLLQYKVEISSLKKRCYTDQQIRDWLAQNGIDVSREAVRKFIKNHLMDSVTAEDSAAPTANSAPARDDGAPPTPGADRQSQVEKMRRRLREQQQEAETTLFKHDKTGKNN